MKIEIKWNPKNEISLKGRDDRIFKCRGWERWRSKNSVKKGRLGNVKSTFKGKKESKKRKRERKKKEKKEFFFFKKKRPNYRSTKKSITIYLTPSVWPVVNVCMRFWGIFKRSDPRYYVSLYGLYGVMHMYVHFIYTDITMKVSPRSVMVVLDSWIL